MFTVYHLCPWQELQLGHLHFSLLLKFNLSSLKKLSVGPDVVGGMSLQCVTTRVLMHDNIDLVTIKRHSYCSDLNRYLFAEMLCFV